MIKSVIWSSMIDYPDNVWLALIPLLNEKELIPSKIDIDRFKDRLIVFDCILTRLKELKSNRMFPGH